MSGKQYASEAERCCGGLENAIEHTEIELCGELPPRVQRVLEMGLKWLARKKKKRAAQWDRYGIGKRRSQ